MTNSELLGEGMRIYRHTDYEPPSRVETVTLDIVKLETSESIQLTQEQLKEIWPHLYAFVESTFGEEGYIE